MKPTKKRIYCPSAGRSKILFESEAKARNFIKFNASDIQEESGVAPQRAYYCEACCGWHVTHKQHYNQHKDIRSTSKVVNAYREAKEKRDENRKKQNLHTQKCVQGLRDILARMNELVFHTDAQDWDRQELTTLHAKFTYLSGEVKAKTLKRDIRLLFNQITNHYGTERLFPERTAGGN